MPGTYLHRMRESTADMSGTFHRRSHVLEPRENRRPSIPTNNLMMPLATISEPVTPIERPKTAHDEEKPEPVEATAQSYHHALPAMK